MLNTLLSPEEFAARVLRPLVAAMRADFARDPEGFRAWWIVRQQDAAAMGETMLLRIKNEEPR